MIQFSNYLLVFLVFLGSGFLSWKFYQSQNILNSKVKFGFVSLRFLSILTIGLILLSPIVKCNLTKKVNPKVIFLIDNSKSIKLVHNTSILNVKSSLEPLAEKFRSEGYQTEFKSFDLELQSIGSLNGNGKQTNILTSLTSTFETNTNENIKKIILVTDGNYNSGTQPSYMINTPIAEIHCVLIGDTNMISDLKIENLEYNSTVLANEKNDIYINFSASKVKNKEFKLDLEKIIGDKTIKVASKNFHSTQDFYNSSASFKLTESVKGKHKYRVSLSPINSEKNITNNSKQFFIEVIDGIKNIEIIASSPHPDLSAIKSSIEKNKSFRVKLNINESNSTFDSKSDLLLLYQIPNLTNAKNSIIQKANALGKSILYIIGSQTNLTELNLVQKQFKVNLKATIDQDYFPLENPNFNKFFLSEETKFFLKTVPPLTNKLISIEHLSESSTLFYSKYGNINSTSPLVSIMQSSTQSIGVLTAENIWKWKVHDYLKNNSTVHFEELLNKLISLLAIKRENKQLSVINYSDKYKENETVKIIAHTYNELYQPIQADKITCEIKSKTFSKIFSMQFQNNSYEFSNNSLPYGNYEYTISALINNKLHIEKGNLEIEKNEDEMEYLPANYNEMNNLCQLNHGEVILYSNLKNIKTEFYQLKDKKSKIINELHSFKLNDIIYLLMTLLFLLCLEFILRKYYGLL